MFYRPVSLLGTGLAVTLLGGCLGTDNPDFNKQAIEAIQFVNGLEDLPKTEVADLPTGLVEYRGVATLNYDEPISNANPGTDLFADITLNVDFAGNDITGTIDNLNSANGNVSGSIDVTDGSITNTVMQSNANGEIVDGDETIAIELDMVGDFRGEDGSAVTGLMSGSYTPEGGEEGDLFGSFGADSN